ncbi:MAG: hypothetical protein PHW33_01145 [Candidatus Portnoybacteria bacterium]|nr:hypothetical protein [Candidatus Portnoybacteria bacterium]
MSDNIPTERPGPQFIAMAPLDRSALTGLFRADVTQYLRITKLAIKQYLEECLKPDGQFRTFFDKVATYTVGYHVNQKLGQDADDRHLQIATFYDNMQERPPQIFIQDNGYQYVTNSLGSLNAGWNLNTSAGHQVVRVMDVVKIPIDITCVAMSVVEVEDLQAVLSTAFGQLCCFTINYILRQAPDVEGSLWEVRIPLSHTMGAKSHSAVHGDPRNQFWSVSCTMEVEFENSILLQYRSDPRAVPLRGTIRLSVPDTLRVGQPHRITLLNQPKPVQVYSNDPRIAVVSQRGYQWIIEPRRVGTFKLMVTRLFGSQQDGPEVLASHDVTVVAR